MKKSFIPFPNLESERLKFLQLKEDHKEAIFNYQSNKENFPYVDMPIYEALKDAENYIKKMNEGISLQKWIIWAIMLQDEIIGTISIWNLDEEKNKAELGYGLYQGYRKKGYMSEAIKRIETFAKEEMLLSTLDAYTNEINVDSITLLKRNHYKYISTFTETETTDGQPFEMVIYRKEL